MDGVPVSDRRIPRIAGGGEKGTMRATRHSPL